MILGSLSWWHREISPARGGKPVPPQPVGLTLLFKLHLARIRSSNIVLVTGLLPGLSMQIFPESTAPTRWVIITHQLPQLNLALMLGQRLRRWPSTKEKLGQHIVSAGLSHAKCATLVCF